MSVADHVVERLRRGEFDLPEPHPHLAAFLDAAIRGDVGEGWVLETLRHLPDRVEATLETANAPALASGRRCADIREALSRFGPSRVAALVVAGMLLDDVYGDDHEGWARALATGAWAAEIATRAGHHPERALIAGLLADVGDRLADLHAGEKASPQDKAAVRQRVGRTLGMRLIRAWRMPRDVDAAILAHGDPSRAPRYRDLVWSTSLARALTAWVLGDGAEDPSEHPGVGALGLNEDDLSSLLARSEQVVDGMLAVS